MKVIAEGVKGLLRMRRDSFVVCALMILEASERRASGLGGSWMSACDDVGDCIAVRKFLMRAVIVTMVAWRVARLSVFFTGAMLL